MTAEQPLEEGARRRRRIDLTRRGSLLREGMKGDVSGDRVLSQIAGLRRLFSHVFIPLEPYPARYARHLPHAGKAMVRGIVCILPLSHGRRCPEGAEVGSAAV